MVVIHDTIREDYVLYYFSINSHGDNQWINPQLTINIIFRLFQRAGSLYNVLVRLVCFRGLVLYITCWSVWSVSERWFSI